MLDVFGSIDAVTWVGLVAALLTTSSFLPQAIKTVISRETSAISLWMYVLSAIGIFLWLVFGLLDDNLPLIAANSVTWPLVMIILIFKLRNLRKDNSAHHAPAASPLAPSHFPELPPISGVTLAAKHCGIRYKSRIDVMIAHMVPETVVAGVFTTSKTRSANIDWARKALHHGQAAVLVVNSGNANAFNGKNGEDSVTRIVDACSDIFACPKEAVYPCSTGVIGEPLPDQKITHALSDLKLQLAGTPDAWDVAARAIMTTDTFRKMATASADINGTTVTINGIAKGSGMIAPHMATMLSYIFTDAAISQDVLQSLLEELVDDTFNAITVDSDTSTSDTCLLFATGRAGNALITDKDDPHLMPFKKALHQLLEDLAKAIIRDGEGATKFVTIHVTGAESKQAAKQIGLAIGNSPLVKTAIAGEDPNWGRIVMAVGKSGERAERDRLTVKIGNATLAKDGQLNPAYEEAKTKAYMQGSEIDIHVDLGIGNGKATIWTCDFTHAYISINADYRS